MKVKFFRISVLFILLYITFSLFVLPLEQFMIVDYLVSWGFKEEPDNKSLVPDGIMTTTSGDIYSIYEKNVTKKTNDWYKQRLVETNMEGLRDDNFSMKPAKGTKRILVLGDSFTFGIGVNSTERYTDIMERRLKRDSGSYEVINAGIAGYGAQDYLNFFKERGRNYEPEVVIISLSQNDIWGRQHIVDYKLDLVRKNKSLNPPINEDEAAYLERRSEIYKKSLLSDSNGTKILHSLKEIENFTDSKIILHGYLLNDEQASTISDWAEENENISYVPRNIKFSVFPSSVYLIPYDNHYNEIGHRWMAEQLTPKVKSLDLQDDT